MKYFIIIFVGIAAFESMAQNSNCAKVLYSTVNLFQITVEVKGPRGSLKFPAIIDTGSSKTLIPESVMKGIGYTPLGKNEFSTAGGKKII